MVRPRRGMDWTAAVLVVAVLVADVAGAGSALVRVGAVQSLRFTCSWSEVQANAGACSGEVELVGLIPDAVYELMIAAPRDVPWTYDISVPYDLNVPARPAGRRTAPYVSRTPTDAPPVGGPTDAVTGMVFDTDSRGVPSALYVDGRTPAPVHTPGALALHIAPKYTGATDIARPGVDVLHAKFMCVPLSAAAQAAAARDMAAAQAGAAAVRAAGRDPAVEERSLLRPGVPESMRVPCARGPAGPLTMCWWEYDLVDLKPDAAYQLKVSYPGHLPWELVVGLVYETEPDPTPAARRLLDTAMQIIRTDERGVPIPQPGGRLWATLTPGGYRVRVEAHYIGVTDTPRPDVEYVVFDVLCDPLVWGAVPSVALPLIAFLVPLLLVTCCGVCAGVWYCKGRDPLCLGPADEPYADADANADAVAAGDADNANHTL